MKNSLLLMLISVIFFMSSSSSCNTRERDITAIKVPGNAVIKGRMTTENGTQPVRNMAIEVYWDGEGASTSSTTRKKNTTFTDENGFYDMRVFVRPDEINRGYFSVSVLADGKGYDYYTQLDSLQTNGFQLSDRSSITQNYSFEKKASLSLNYAPSQIPPVGTKYQVQVSQKGVADINRYSYNNVNYANYYSEFFSVIPIPQTFAVAPNTPLKVLARAVSASNINVVISEKTYNLPAVSNNSNTVFDVIF